MVRENILVARTWENSGKRGRESPSPEHLRKHPHLLNARKIQKTSPHLEGKKGGFISLQATQPGSGGVTYSFSNSLHHEAWPILWVSPEFYTGPAKK
jgi:hypothetical protein